MEIMSLTEIMDKAVDVHKKYIKTTAVFVLIFGIISGLIIGVSSIIGAAIGIPIAMATSSWVVGAIMFTVYFMLAFAFQLCKNVGLTEIFSQEFTMKNINMDRALGAAFKNIGKSITIVVAGTLLASPAIAVFWILGKVLFDQCGKSLIPVGVYGGIEIFLMIAVVLLIIAGIAFTAWFLTIHIFSIHVITLEDRMFFDALKRSRQLVKNNFWKVLGSSIIFNLIVFGIMSSINALILILSGLLLLVLKLLSFQPDIITFFTVIGYLIRLPITMLISIFITPLGWTFITLLYHNQLFKKEGHDLGLRLKEVEKINLERKPLSEGI